VELAAKCGWQPLKNLLRPSSDKNAICKLRGFFAPPKRHCTSELSSRIRLLEHPHLIAGQIGSLAQPFRRTSTPGAARIAALLPGKRRVWVRCRRGDGRIPCRKAKAGQDLLDGIRGIDSGEYSHAPAATGASENVQLEHSFHKSSPRVISRLTATIILGLSRIGCRNFKPGLTARMPRRA
jgi:hypothetical protein